MNSYQNKKRKRNLVKKINKKNYFAVLNHYYYGKYLSLHVPVIYKTLHQVMFEEALIFGKTISIEECINIALLQGKITFCEALNLKEKLKNGIL